MSAFDRSDVESGSYSHALESQGENCKCQGSCRCLLLGNIQGLFHFTL